MEMIEIEMIEMIETIGGKKRTAKSPRRIAEPGLLQVLCPPAEDVLLHLRLFGRRESAGCSANPAGCGAEVCAIGSCHGLRCSVPGWLL